MNYSNNGNENSTISDSQCKFNETFWDMISGKGGSCEVPPGYDKNSCTLIGNNCYSNTAPQCTSSDQCYFDLWKFRCANKDPSKGDLHCKSDENSWNPFSCKCDTITPGIHPINYPDYPTITPGIHPINYPDYPTIAPGIHTITAVCQSNTWTESCINMLIHTLQTKYGVTDINILNCTIEYLTLKTTPNNIPEYLIQYAIDRYCKVCQTMWTTECQLRLIELLKKKYGLTDNTTIKCCVNYLITKTTPNNCPDYLIKYAIDYYCLK